MFFIIVAGFFAFNNISKEEFPEISLNAVTIITTYPGVSPEEIEELITKPIEEEVTDVEDIDNITSFSSEGRSLITVKFKIEAGDIYRKKQEVQTEVDKVTDLPEDANDPIVKDSKHFFHLITIGIVGSNNERKLNEIAEDMVYDFKKIYGVGEVEIRGNREREIWVEVDQVRLEGYGLSLFDVINALKRKNLNLPGGIIKLSRDELIVRTVGEFNAVKEIQDIVIRSSEKGGHVYLRDIARVADRFEEPILITKINGKKSINISLRKGDVGNIVDIVQEAKEVAMSYQSRLPESAEIIFANDNSTYLKKKLNILYGNGLSGLMLVLLTLFLFIGTRSAIVTAFGLPVAFCASILLMNTFSITVNSFSLFSLIIVLGMIVDDAIIVTENVYRYIEQGVPIRQAALMGTQEVFWPVTAAVSTTIAAFLPMLLMEGPLGKFMAIIPQVVTFALLASLWEAFFILPSHLAEFARPPKKRTSRGAQSTWFTLLQRTYEVLLRKCLQRRYLVLSSVGCAAAAILLTAFGTLDFILFPNRDFDLFLVKVEAPSDSTIEHTRTISDQTEKFLLTLPPDEMLSVETNIGLKTANLGLVEGGYEYGSNFAQIHTRLVDHQDRKRDGEEILRSIRTLLDTLKNPHFFRVDKEMAGPPVGKAVAVRIMGDDFQVLQTIAKKVREELNTIKGVKDIEDDFLPGKSELKVIVDEDKAALYQIDVERVALAIQYAYKGGVATEFKDKNDEIDVVVKFNANVRNDLFGVLDLKIPNAAGHLIPLKNVASLERTSGYAKIRRYDQKRKITVTANIESGVNNSRDVNNEVKKRMKPYMDRFPGYIIQYGGEYEDTQKSMRSLAEAFILAIFLIYMIIASTFKSFIQPFMLMVTIPLAIMGVFIGLIVMRTPMGMMSFLGIIALTGIVVNDSIVLIDFINRRRAKGGDRIEATIEASKTRLRPIMLTSITTILGLTPLAWGIFGKEPMLTPMAISIAWGLTFSSTLTLFLIPSLYTVVEDAKERFWKKNRDAS
jgi:multidrug efflux pump subunit AcrB